MSSGFKYEGVNIPYTNPSSSVAIAYGSVVDLDTRIAIAAATIAASAAGNLVTEGVFEIAAINTAAFTVGESLYWNGTALTNDGTGNLTPAGWCVETKAETAALARVKLIG